MPDYLYERPSLERITEAVERLEETLSDKLEKPLAPMGATVTLGPAGDARALVAGPREGRTAGDPVTAFLGESIKGLLDRSLDQGPPAAWGCPPPVEPQKRPAAAASLPAGD